VDAPDRLAVVDHVVIVRAATRRSEVPHAVMQLWRGSSCQ
jgi:hypothetical protein